MATKILNTRIQLKYDTLNNWIASAQTNPSFKPLKGEVCIVEIPQINTSEQTSQNNQNHLTPPAIGIKVGDGNHNFLELPWIQAIAGDVYSWAKEPSIVNDLTKNDLQNFISQKISDTNTQYQIVSGTGDNSNKYYLQSKEIGGSYSGDTPFLDLTQIINDIESLQNNLNNLDVEDQIDQKIQTLNVNNINGFGKGKTLATLTETNGKIAATFQDIEITKDKITDAGTAIGANVSTTAITDNDSSIDLPTKAQVSSYIATKTAGLTGAMHFIGTATVEIVNGSSTNPIILDYNFSNAKKGDVILYNNAEFVWDGTSWKLLGDEGSYAIKGSIVKTDLATNLQNEIDNKINKNGTDRLITATEGAKLETISENAQVNIIEKITVPSDTDSSIDKELSITNKTIKLSKIAETGNINNLIQEQGDYLILYCGNADEVIDNFSAS